MGTYQTYFNTQGETLREFYQFITDSGYNFEELTMFQVEHIDYGCTQKYHIPLQTKKGNPARKWAHAAIYRMDNGNYELTMYLN